jgi:hypothetical protein
MDGWMDNFEIDTVYSGHLLMVPICESDMQMQCSVSLTGLLTVQPTIFSLFYLLRSE